MNTKPLPKAWLPNSEGFTFIAVFPDGSTKEDTIVKNEKGLHTCTYFHQMIGWYRIN